MSKGNGKGNQSTSWKREVGTYPHLKNFRKGLRFQRNLCFSELAESPGSATSCLVYARFLDLPNAESLGQLPLQGLGPARSVGSADGV